MKRWKRILRLLLSLGVALWTREGWAASRTPPPQGSRVFSVRKIDGNNWEINLDNTGRHASPYSRGLGGYWPKGSGQNYIWGAGIWIGALFNDRQDTLVSWGYDPGYGASGMGPTTPDGDETKDADPLARVYLSTDPNDRQRWPEVDSTGKIKIRSAMDSWAMFSDVNTNYNRPPDRPMGVLVKRISYQWPYPGFSDVVFFLFTVENVTNRRPVPGGARTFTDCILGNCMDNDIGAEYGSSGNDQFTLNMTYHHKANGDSVLRNLAMQFQTIQEPGWGPPPYWMGARFFESPKATRPVTITSQNFPEANRTVQTGQQLGMTACKLFTAFMDPTSAPQRYLELAGYYYPNPVYEPYDNDFPGPSDHRFLQSSGPFDLPPGGKATITIAIIGGQDYWAVVGASDKAQDIFDSNFSGPVPPTAPNLTLIPGNKKVTLLWDNTSENTPDPYYNIIWNPSQKAKYRSYDFQGYKVFKARSLADLGDPTRRVLLGSWDLKDGFMVVPDADSGIIGKPPVKYGKYDTLGWDTGIRYSLVDTGQIAGDSIGIANGFPYFYGVVGFDYQYWDTLIGGLTVHMPGNPTTLTGDPTEKYAIAIPRVDAENQRKAMIDSLGFIKVGPSYASGVVSTSPHVVINPFVTNHTYVYRWNPVQKDTFLYPTTNGQGGIPLYTFTIRDSTLHQDLKTVKAYVDTLDPYTWTGVLDMEPLVDGISFEASYTMKVKGFRYTWLFGPGTITPASTYTDTVFADSTSGFSGFSPFIPMKWSARGSLFKITWHRSGGSRGDSLLTVTIRDSSNRVDIPFEGGKALFNLRQASWSFGVDCDSVGYPSIDSMACSGSLNVHDKKNARWLYLCGYRYLFNYHKIFGQRRPDKMVWVRRPADGEVWFIQMAGPYPPVEGNWMAFTVASQAMGTTTDAMLDRIKVVPNPYLVKSNWDSGTPQKHLMFTHLPDECTIRIFTLAGDLIKVIHHTRTSDFSALGGKTPNASSDYDPSLGTGSNLHTGGVEFWDLLTYNSQKIASGIYLYRVDVGGSHKLGKFAVIQ